MLKPEVEGLGSGAMPRISAIADADLDARFLAAMCRARWRRL